MLVVVALSLHLTMIYAARYEVHQNRVRARERGDGSLPRRPRSRRRDNDLVATAAVAGDRLHAGAGHRRWGQGRRWAVATCSTSS